MGVDFGKSNSVKQKTSSTADNIPISALNLEQLAGLVGITRDMVDKIVSKIIYVLGRSIREGRIVSLLIHKVASIDICGGELKCEFIPEFIEELRSANVASKTRVQPMTRSGGSSRINYTSGNSTGNTVKGASVVNERLRPGSAQLLGRSKSATATNIINNEMHRPSSSHSMRSMSTTSTNLTSANLTRLQKVNIENSQRVRSSSNAGNIAGEASGNYVDLDADGNVTNKRATRNGEGVSVAMGNPRAAAAKALGTNNIIQKVRELIIKRGGSSGIVSLGRLLRIMDDDNDKRLSRNELKFGLKNYGVELSATELEQVFLYFDKSGDGFISVDEFLIGRMMIFT